MLGRYDEADDDNVRPFVECGSAKSEVADVAISDLDWFGNTTLHHCFANNEIILPSVCKVLEKFPEYALVKNQFGRIPLHYALDRIKVNVDGVRKLIEVYPEGVWERDNDNKTPYDVAVKWKHSNEIKKLLLDVDPNLDRATYFRIRYGMFAVLYNFFFRVDRQPKRSRIYSNIDLRSIEDKAHETAGQQGGGNNDESSGDTQADMDRNVSTILSGEQPSASLLTVRGDISEQNSYANFPSSTSRLAQNGTVRRSSVTEQIEEENSQGRQE